MCKIVTFILTLIFCVLTGFTKIALAQHIWFNQKAANNRQAYFVERDGNVAAKVADKTDTDANNYYHAWLNPSAKSHEVFNLPIITYDKLNAKDPDHEEIPFNTMNIWTDKVQLSDFLKLNFGMFIHFNMATFNNAQWVAGYLDPAVFNPNVETIDTDAWADAAVAAGMKYAVLTTKHVSGFCLWDSKYTSYDVMHPDCPYQKDLVAQFVKSFTEKGLKVGLYYCWRHPGFDSNNPKGTFKVLPPECDPSTHSIEEQIDFQKAQIKELLSMYPDVFYIWNDALDSEIMEAKEILPFFREIRPDIIASANWWDWSKKGIPYADIAVTETRHFPEDNEVIGETCWKLEDQWFWNGNTETKSAASIIEVLEKVNARNANLLLNVGPDKNGNILPQSEKTLIELGELLNSSN